MSTSLLYHGFGIRGYNYVSSDDAGGEVRFRIEQPRETLRCAACGCDEVVLHGCQEREFCTLPIGGKPVRVVLPIPRSAAGPSKDRPTATATKTSSNSASTPYTKPGTL